VFVLCASAVRFQYHTGRFGLVSENGSLNMMFGRCHAGIIEGVDAKAEASFGLPEFGGLSEAEEQYSWTLVHLAPALSPTIRYEGYIGDSAIHADYIRRCIEVTGWVGQAYYGFTHLVLLWAYNVPWPDQGLDRWRGWARTWQWLATATLCVPGFLGLLTIFKPQRNVKLSILNLQTAALFLMAVIYFGGTRHRNPYDPLFIVIAAVFYQGLYRRWRQRTRQRAEPTPAEPVRSE
jgi:hypothetical protein